MNRATAMLGFPQAIAAALLILGTTVVASSLPAPAFPKHSPNDVLVRFDWRASKASRADSLFARLGLGKPQALFPDPPGRPRPARGGLDGWRRYHLDGELSLTQVVDSLNHMPGVTAQPNYFYRPLAVGDPTDAVRAQTQATVPNDPEWPNQWGPRLIGLAEVWERTAAASRESTVVAVIDLGVDYRHEDLASRMWRNAAEGNGVPGLDDDGNGYVDDTIGWDFTDAPDVPGRGDYLDRDNDPMDESGHGTSVAGLIAAVINNGQDIAGIAPTARIMALRAGADLVFGAGFLEEDDIAAAIAYAVENGARVINMSFGGDAHTPLMYDAVTYAYERGVVLIAAAGNDCSEAGLVFPAAYDETISAAATSESDVRAVFSCYGENLDIAAPGQGIVVLRLGGGTMRNNGTSFAAPHVAGAAAIVLSMAPDLAPREVRSLLRAGVVDLGPPGWDAETGFGRLDLPTLLRVASAPVAEIAAPVRPAGADTGTAWSLFAQGAPPVAWSLNYGVGSSPRVWTTLASGVLAAASDTVLGTFDTRSLPDTTCALRLVATDALGRSREDRTVLTVDHTPPVFSCAPTLRRRWQDTEERLLLEWTTDDLTLGTLLVWRGNSSQGEPTLQIPLEFEDTHHLMPLRREAVGGGSFTVRVRAVNRAGLTTESEPLAATVQPFTVPRNGFDVITRLPPGVLMPGVTDFDGNGVPEVVIKPSNRAPYDTVSVYELSPTGTARFVFDSPVLMRPAAATDIDGDGLIDLIGIDQPSLSMTRVRIAGQAAIGLPPRTTWWTGDYLLGPTVGDADGDGRIDMIALVDTNRAILRMYESSGPRQLDLVAELVSPVPGVDGRFGTWRAVLDIDGDGRPDVVAGTTGGSVVIFPSTGNNAFGTPRVIPGKGDAVRVWGGIDLTGDGRADFAVLRHIEEDRFDLDKRFFRLEVYGADTSPVLVREFADPRTEGNGFAVGPVGPGGAPALVIAVPPRLYVLAPSVSSAAGLTWFGETAIPAQPLIADLDQSGGPELVVQGADSILVMRPVGGRRPPAAPTNVRVRAYDSVSVEVTWDALGGLEYRIWMGPDAGHLARLQPFDPVPPTVLGGLQAGVPVVVTVQAVNPLLADSIGLSSEPMSAMPHAGPQVVSALLVEPDRILTTFDHPLDAKEVTLGCLAVVAGGVRTGARSFILDRSQTRLLLTFPSNTVSHANHGSALLSFVVRDTAGARREGSVPLTLAPRTDKPGISYALVTEPTVLRLAFTHPIDPTSLTATNVSVLPSRSVTGIASLDADGCAFDIRFADALVDTTPFVVELTGLRTRDGQTFSAGTVIDGKPLSGQPLRIVSVLQRSSSELWLVTSEPAYRDDLTAEAVSITPRVTVREVAEGPTPNVLVVKLDPNTPVGPWEAEYQIAVSLGTPGAPLVLQARWQPLADRPYTGHLRAVQVLGATALQLRFDVLIAHAGHPDRSVRVEPGLEVTGITVQDSLVTVSLSERTRLGPWGITYFVRVDGLLSADGEHLAELYAFSITPPMTLDSVTIFPQPFRPGFDHTLTFGGLPPGAKVRIYTLDGILVQELSPTDTGGTTWDGRNEAGRAVASGVFLYVVDSPRGRKAGKIAVMR